MPERIRRISGLVRPENRGSGALSVGAAGTAGKGGASNRKAREACCGTTPLPSAVSCAGRPSPGVAVTQPASRPCIHSTKSARSRPAPSVGAGAGRVRLSHRVMADPYAPHRRSAPPPPASPPPRGAGPPPTREAAIPSGAAARGTRVAGPRRRQQRRSRTGQGHVAIAVPLVRRTLDSVRRLRGRQQQPLDLVGQVRTVPPLFRFDGCWLPPFLPMLLVGVFSRVPGGPCGEEGPLAAVWGPDVGGAKHEPLRVVPEVGQGSEYGTECPQSRLTCGVSQTPRAGFHVARGTGGEVRRPRTFSITTRQGRRAATARATCSQSPERVWALSPARRPATETSLTGEASRQDAHPGDGGPVDGGDIAQVRDAGPVAGQDA